MIAKIEFMEGCKYFKRLEKKEWFGVDKSIEFKEGLNVIVGNNGSGKSTILEAIALHLAAEQGGVSKVTNSWLSFALRDFKSKVTHDGQPIIYTNSNKKFGMIDGIALDDDFLAMGVEQCVLKASHGERSVYSITDTADIIRRAKPFPDQLSASRDSLLKDGRYKAQSDGLLSASIEVSQKTILMDEPDAGMSPLFQHKFWWNVIRQNTDFQIIVATQSPYCMGLDNVNYIELNNNWIRLTKESIIDLGLFII